jgi:hypothetical protein
VPALVALPSAVADCGKCDKEDEDSLACLIRGVDAYGTRRLGLRRADEFPGARLLLSGGGSKTREWASDVLRSGAQVVADRVM